MADLIADILNVSTLAYWVGGTLAVSAGILVMSMTSLLWLSSLAVTFSFFGAITGVYCFREWGIYLASDKNAHLVLAACAGMLVGMLLLMVVVRGLYMIAEWTQPEVKRAPATR